MHTIQTIPELLVKTRGNLTKVAAQLAANRATVSRYARDFKAESHIIVNGKLMTAFGDKGKFTASRRWQTEREPHPKQSEVIALRRAGKKFWEIRDATGISVSTCCKWWRQHNVE